VFLSKCSSKSEEIDYRPIFENFIQDLLTTVNKPEWPASELMLSVLGRLLVANFVNKNLDMSLRVASLDYLGVVAARLRKDSVTSQLRLKTIDSIIMDIRTEELKDEDGNLMVCINDTNIVYFNFFVYSVQRENTLILHISTRHPAIKTSVQFHYGRVSRRDTQENQFLSGHGVFFRWTEYS